MGVLPPTSPDLNRNDVKPYFLWWCDASTGDLRAHLADDDPQTRAYWLGALLREANTRDVWLFTTPDAIRRDWAHLQRHLGRSGPMWGFLLGLPYDIRTLRAQTI